METDAETAEVERLRRQLLANLDAAAQRGKPILFWWRDDDAADVTPRLEALVAVCSRHDVPLALAIIPSTATERLAACVKADPGLVPIQHGWAHKSHADKGRRERASEFPRSRALEDGLADLERGFQRMAALFGGRFQPILTPPWNRISAPIRLARHEVGLRGISTFSRIKFDDIHHRNCHVDIIKWRDENRFAGRVKAYRRLVAQTRRRLEGVDQPVGLLTHHLVHDDAADAFMDEALGLLRDHPGVRWPSIPDLFDL
ncbi:MAG: polysaccharide deacetylase family protein [Pseudomonadota bacterium]